jgi:hypothetical protein
VKSRFQRLPFKCNLQRYKTDAQRGMGVFKRSIQALKDLNAVVGLCRLNQVDPYPMTYSLSNP